MNPITLAIVSAICLVSASISVYLDTKSKK